MSHYLLAFPHETLQPARLVNHRLRRHRHQKSRMSNNSFKPKPLRSSKGMAERACHAFASTTRFGLTQALDRARRRVRATSVRPSRRAAFPRLAQTFDPRHKLRAGKNAGTPFLGSAFQSEIIGNSWPGSSQAQIVGSTLGSGHRCWLRATAGTGLTIRSSRHRFAASCKVLAIKPDTPPQSGAS